jgi:anti-sigma B factor antagonist
MNDRSPTDGITTSVDQLDGIAVVSVVGEIDLVTAPELEQAVAQAFGEEPNALIVDLSAVEYMASVGLRVLVATLNMCESARFAVVANDTTRGIIEVVGLDKIFSLYWTLDDALAAVRT